MWTELVEGTCKKKHDLFKLVFLNWVLNFYKLISMVSLCSILNMLLWCWGWCCKLNCLNKMWQRLRSSTYFLPPCPLITSPSSFVRRLSLTIPVQSVTLDWNHLKNEVGSVCHSSYLMCGMYRRLNQFSYVLESTWITPRRYMSGWSEISVIKYL